MQDTLSYRRLILEKDFDLLKDLVASCSDYYMLLDGYLPTFKDIEALFSHVPTDTPIENLEITGIFEDGKLLGAIWGTKFYPDDETVYIALYLVTEEHRSRGIGRIGFEYFEEDLRSKGFKFLRLAVVKDNEIGLSFWKNNGFESIKSYPSRQFGLKWHEIEEFVKPI